MRGDENTSGAARAQTRGPQTLLILGASGDLTARWLLPGLGGLLAKRPIEGLSLLGSGSRAWSDAEWRGRIARSFATVDARGPAVDAVLRTARYQAADVTKEGDLRRLLDACTGRVILYFALPPAVTVKTCKLLAGLGLPGDTRLVMEKPFGTDAESARALDDLVTRIVPEDSVYRVDHYLGMSTVMDLLGLRFANRIIEPILNAEHVAHVDVISEESLGIGGRAGYYDRAGALVDVIQSHLLQVLSLIAMDPPATLGARDLRDRKAEVLRATRVWAGDPVGSSRRARYLAGMIGDRRVPSYVDEDGVDAARGTETFAELVLAVDTWRWTGVPFHVRAGKAMPALRKVIEITFKRSPRVPTGLLGEEQPDRLVIGIDPSGLRLDLNINGPGDPMVLDRLTLRADVGPGELPPYGQALEAVLRDDSMLSVRGDTAVESWRIVEPVLEAWRAGKVPLEEYVAGAPGPR
jgi:glucose-6-phosphate 1-dehydrogenase